MKGIFLLRRLLIVAYFLEVGLLLILVPWSGYWDRNYFAHAYPSIRDWLTNNFIRGGVSGLGIVNLWLGLTDLARVLSRRVAETDAPAPHPAIGHGVGSEE